MLHTTLKDGFFGHELGETGWGEGGKKMMSS